MVPKLRQTYGSGCRGCDGATGLILSNFDFILVQGTNSGISGGSRRG